MQPIRPGDAPCTVLVDRSRMADPDPVGTEIFMDACMENRIGFISLGDRLDPTEICRSWCRERINLQLDMLRPFRPHRGIQYEIDNILGRDYLLRITQERRDQLYY